MCIEIPQEGKIHISKAELFDIISEAYQEGHFDGRYYSNMLVADWNNSETKKAFDNPPL